MQQLAYRVEDVDAVSAVLRERGLRLLYDEPRRGTSGSRVNFVHPKDAGGVLIELVEPGPLGHACVDQALRVAAVAAADRAHLAESAQIALLAPAARK